MEKKTENFSIKKRLKSFRFAFNGIIILLQEEHNSRIHLLAMTVALILGFALKINSTEWIGIILSIALVIAFELINSAVENLADFCTKEQNILIKKTKDMDTAAVLVASIAALVIGIIIFLPKLIDLL